MRTLLLRFAAPSVLAACCIMALAPAATPSPCLAKEAAAYPYLFTFKDADIADVAEAILGRTLNLTYSIDPDVSAKITFRIDRRMTEAELLQAFEAALSLEDIAVVKSGQTLLLEKRAKAKSSSSVKSIDEGRHALGYQTIAAPLTYASPGEVAKALQAVGAGGVISYIDDTRNELVLSGTAQEIDAALQTIRLFDRPTSGETKIEWYPLEKASATSVAEELSALLRASKVNDVTIVPLKRLNGLYAFARTAADLESVRAWVRKLDIASEDKTNTLWIYRPHNASAESLKAALSSVIGLTSNDGTSSTPDTKDRKPSDPSAKTPSQQNAATASTPSDTAPAITVLADGVRIGVDKETNALLVSAAPAQWVQIQRILADLDRSPGQILIEASIVEVTLTKDDAFGVNFSVLGSNKRLTTALSSASDGSVTPSFPGFALSYAGSSVKAAIDALGSNSRVEVISAPKIIVLDGKVANLSVGDDVPIVSQSAQSTTAAGAPLVNTVDYRNTGVILKVTPRITGNDTILLDVTQEVSSVTATTTSAIDSPTISQRHLDSSLIINDGEVVALGGMISSTKSKSDSGLPFVKDLPGVGALFRTSSNDSTRTELVVLLTAKILRDRAGSDRVMADLYADMQDLKAHGLLHP